MTSSSLEPKDEDLRGVLTREIARLGRAPSDEQLAFAARLPQEEIAPRLQRLAAAHALLLHPGTTRPWAVHPFALAPGACWVQTPAMGYWANCLYCAFGIAAALHSDAIVTTRYGGEAEAARFEIAGGSVIPADGVFHLSTPPARWWDNVIFACSTFQPFRDEADVDGWCARHGLPRGETLTIPRLQGFAADWYGGYLDQPWRKRSTAEAREVFARHGLSGSFWQI